jgi:hypothetical protein
MDTQKCGERYLVYGSGQLSIAVIRELLEKRPAARIDLISDDKTAQKFKPRDDEHPDNKRVEHVSDHEDLAAVEASLEEATPNCLLLLDDHDEDNIRAATAAFRKNAKLPVVVHTFDPRFADLLEQRYAGDLRVRRAYSRAGIAAPFFVAAALGQTNVVTMRFGDVELPVARLELDPRGRGVTPEKASKDYGVKIIAILRPDADRWSIATGADEDKTIPPGSHVLVGGRQADVVRFAYKTTRPYTSEGSEWRDKAASRLHQLRDEAAAAFNALVPSRTVGLLLAAAAAVIVVAYAFSQDPALSDLPYRVVRTALGEEQFTRLNGVGTVLLVIGAIIWGSVVGAIASAKTVGKLRDDVRAQHLRDHVIVAGLGETGYRICVLLHEAGIEYLVIDPAPDVRFADAVRRNGAMITGDIRLEETLLNAGVERARAVIACSRDNLANVEACIRAEHDHDKGGPRSIATVARVFDDDVAESAGTALGINRALAAVECAAPAFADAAIDQTARRPFALEDPREERRGEPLAMMGQRLHLDSPNEQQNNEWWRRDVRLIAWRLKPRDDKHARGGDLARSKLTDVEPPSENLPPPGERIDVAVVGEKEAVEDFRKWAEGELHAEIDDGGDHGEPGALDPDRFAAAPA